MVYEARYLARNCELKTRLGDIVSHLRHLSHLSQDKTKLLFSFFLILFNYAIQGKFITWLVNSALNCTWKPISHSSLRDSCDIGFQVQFNAEFPRQVMNFPIESWPPRYTPHEKTFFTLALALDLDPRPRPSTLTLDPRHVTLDPRPSTKTYTLHKHMANQRCQTRQSDMPITAEIMQTYDLACGLGPTPGVLWYHYSL